MVIGREIEVVLRSIIFQVMTADLLEIAENAIMAMCTKEDIAVAKQRAEIYKSLNSKQQGE